MIKILTDKPKRQQHDRRSSESGEELVSANSNGEDAARSSDGSIDKQLIQSIPVTVTAELGRTKIKLRITSAYGGV